MEERPKKITVTYGFNEKGKKYVASIKGDEVSIKLSRVEKAILLDTPSKVHFFRGGSFELIEDKIIQEGEFLAGRYITYRKLKNS
jgi:hypothetical protein